MPLRVRRERKPSDFHMNIPEHKNMAGSASHEERGQRKSSGSPKSAICYDLAQQGLSLLWDSTVLTHDP